MYIKAFTLTLTQSNIAAMGLGNLLGEYETQPVTLDFIGAKRLKK